MPRCTARSCQQWPQGGEPAGWTGLGDDVPRERAALLCDRLVVELGAPRMSRDVFAPADAERWLISYLADRVGIGRFPNEHVEPEAAADRLTQLATRQRSRPGILTADDARQRLQVHESFGRLDQLTPIDSKVEVRRGAIAARLVRCHEREPPDDAVRVPLRGAAARPGRQRDARLVVGGPARRARDRRRRTAGRARRLARPGVQLLLVSRPAGLSARREQRP
jgi:hypothetical protein